MDEDKEFDIYEDIQYDDLNKESEKLLGNIAKLQEDNAKFLTKIDTLVKEKEKLIQKNRILQKNISSLLKTAKEEIKRKDAQIVELRTELEKVQAKRSVHEYPVKKINKDVEYESKNCKRPDTRSRVGDKNSVDRNLSSKRDDNRYGYRRRSRSPHRSKSPYRKRAKSPFDRKRRRTRSPVDAKKRHWSRTRSDKQISSSPVRSSSPKNVKNLTECPKEIQTEVAISEQRIPEPMETEPVINRSDLISPIVSEISPVVNSSPPEREEGEIDSDQNETVNMEPPKTLYTLRMAQKIANEDEEAKKKKIVNEAEEAKKEKTLNKDEEAKKEKTLNKDEEAKKEKNKKVDEEAKKEKNGNEPEETKKKKIVNEDEEAKKKTTPECVESPNSLNLSKNTDEIPPAKISIETLTPFKENYKLVPWSPMVSTIAKKIPRRAVIPIDKPQKQLTLTDLETKKTEPNQPGFDIKTYHIPKKNKIGECKKGIASRRKAPNKKINGIDPPEKNADIANFEIFKTAGNKNTSLETRCLHNDLHLSDSEGHADEATTEESSGSSSDSAASDIVDLI